MKVDQKKLNELAELSDADLWQQIRAMLAERGVRLAQTQPSTEDLERLREILRCGKGINISEGARLLAEYKRKYGR